MEKLRSRAPLENCSTNANFWKQVIWAQQNRQNETPLANSALVERIHDSKSAGLRGALKANFDLGGMGVSCPIGTGA